MLINSNPNSFAKTICSICFEDLKPITEDLQCISICGHVFHELCLQQWFEYCPSTKKRSCPICKQSCNASSVSRLYFQSVGEQNDASVTQKESGFEEDQLLFRCEVKKLEGKLSGLGSVVESQRKEIKQLNEELHICKDQLKKEITLRNAAQEQKLAIQQILVLKSEENDALKLERSKLHDRNMALAKELAAIKLVSDLSLEEDEVLKLASFGNEGNNKDTIDILKRSLVIRNKSYKELMAKCNELGRGEARSCKRLDKAKEKINKLKARVHELETVIESKDNEALRALKVSKKKSDKGVTLNGFSNDHQAFPANNSTLKGRKKQHSPLNCLELRDSDQEDSKFNNDTNTISIKEDTSTMPFDTGAINYVVLDDAELLTATPSISELQSKHTTREDAKSTTKPELVSETIRDSGVQKLNGVNPTFVMKTPINIDIDHSLHSSKNDDVAMPPDAIEQHQPIFSIRKECPSTVPLSKPGDLCFSSGLLGPDGTNRYLGKWCKRGQSKGSQPMLGSGTSNRGDLIAIGADGRGGRIKVLRSADQSFLKDKENSASAKRCKFGNKSSSLQSQGCLQIEHFFGRATH